MPINKIVKDTQPDTINQNDPWYQAFEKEMIKITNNGVTWHEELFDKGPSFKTHNHFGIRNCDKDPEIIRCHLLNIAEHYINNHPKCCCCTDPNYMLSRVIIKSKSAEQILKKAIRQSLYKTAEDYYLDIDTFYVESFNNILNMFQDKRISFFDEEYARSSNIGMRMLGEIIPVSGSPLKLQHYLMWGAQAA